MADTLKRIVGPANIASGTSTLFTGTAAHTYTFKEMTITNPSTSAITIALYIQTSAGAASASENILPTSTIEAGGMAEWNGMKVLTGTEVIRAVASASGLTFTASGLDQV